MGFEPTASILGGLRAATTPRPPVERPGPGHPARKTIPPPARTVKRRERPGNGAGQASSVATQAGAAARRHPRPPPGALAEDVIMLPRYPGGGRRRALTARRTMGLRERLEADQKDAMRSGHTIRLNTIRMLRNAIQQADLARVTVM